MVLNALYVRVVDITKTICNERQVDSIRDKHGKFRTKEGEVSARWKEHFSEVLNRPKPPEPVDIETVGAVELGIDEDPPTYEELRTVIRELRMVKHQKLTTSLLNSYVQTWKHQ